MWCLQTLAYGLQLQACPSKGTNVVSPALMQRLEIARYSNLACMFE